MLQKLHENNYELKTTVNPCVKKDDVAMNTILISDDEHIQEINLRDIIKQ